MMYALQLPKWHNGIPTDHPAGMFIDKVGKCTDSKASAELFVTSTQAEQYAHDWRNSSKTVVHDKEKIPLWVVSVDTKQVMTKVLSTIRPV
jgi:predicted nuclease of restriction endonuclease-like RecB superfamily